MNSTIDIFNHNYFQSRGESASSRGHVKMTAQERSHLFLKENNQRRKVLYFYQVLFAYVCYGLHPGCHHCRSLNLKYCILQVTSFFFNILDICPSTGHIFTATNP